MPAALLALLPLFLVLFFAVLLGRRRGRGEEPREPGVLPVGLLVFIPKIFEGKWKRVAHVGACAVGVVQDVLPVDEADVVCSIKASQMLLAVWLFLH